MRLPLLEDGSIDKNQVKEMIKLCMDKGINYFDTAMPYHDGQSEIVIGELLKEYPRDSYYIASKYPGHQKCKSYNPKETFEFQLKKCQIEYFDFYLMHNVCENSLSTYENKEYKILDYFIEQKEKGRIKYLGFSSHARVETLKYILDKYGKYFDFVQIQLNYLDWTLQDAKEKYELITSYGLPIWVMEPVRGGKLVDIGKENEDKLRSIDNSKSIASWAFEWLKSKENCKVILSGMSNIEQMLDNIKTFEKESIMTLEIEKILFNIADSLKKGVPCTSCKYCMKGCPRGLEIPTLLSLYNDIKYYKSFNVTMMIDAMSDDKKPNMCVKCGACKDICPQKIDIPKTLTELDDIYNSSPKWDDICRQREEASEKLKMMNKQW